MTVGVKVGNLMILGGVSVTVGSGLGRIARQLSSGTFEARSGSEISHRRDNSMWYCSGMAMEILIAATSTGIWIAAFATLVGWHSIWH